MAVSNVYVYPVHPRLYVKPYAKSNPWYHLDRAASLRSHYPQTSLCGSRVIGRTHTPDGIRHYVNFPDPSFVPLGR
jgi:hypothetical protein